MAAAAVARVAVGSLTPPQKNVAVRSPDISGTHVRTAGPVLVLPARLLVSAVKATKLRVCVVVRAAKPGTETVVLTPAHFLRTLVQIMEQSPARLSTLVTTQTARTKSARISTAIAQLRALA